MKTNRVLAVVVTVLAVAFMASADDITGVDSALKSVEDTTAIPEETEGVVCDYGSDKLVIAAAATQCYTPFAIIDTRGTLVASNNCTDSPTGMCTSAYPAKDLVTGNDVAIKGPVYGFSKGQRAYVTGSIGDQEHKTVFVLITN